MLTPGLIWADFMDALAVRKTVPLSGYSFTELMGKVNEGRYPGSRKLIPEVRPYSNIMEGIITWAFSAPGTTQTNG